MGSGIGYLERLRSTAEASTVSVMIYAYAGARQLGPTWPTLLAVPRPFFNTLALPFQSHNHFIPKMASDTSEPLDGYAIRRNNSCATSETDCGGTWDNWRQCCPGTTQCPRSADSGICCPTWQDCSNSLINNAHCADQTATLYYVEYSRGFVCCSNDTVGFHLKDNGYVGCAKDLKTAGSNTQAAIPVTTATSTATGSSKS